LGGFGAKSKAEVAEEEFDIRSGSLSTFDVQLRGGGDVAVQGPTVRPVSAPSEDVIPSLAHSAAYLSNGQQYVYRPMAVEEGPLAECMRMIQTQERALLVQASRCRAAVARLSMIQRLMAGRGMAGLDAKLASEVTQWKTSTKNMQVQLGHALSSAGKEVADLLGEKPLGLIATEETGDLSSVTPEYHSEDDDKVMEAKGKAMDVPQGPTIRNKQGALVSQGPSQGPTTAPLEQEKQQGPTVVPQKQPVGAATWSHVSHAHPSVSPPKHQVRVFSPEVEAKYRVATFYGIPVYGAVPVPGSNGSVLEYPGDTELHLVWDVDQSKLVGEGTNDVELVIKCVLWWKEELSHDPHFIPHKVPNHIRDEFKEYCASFDLDKALESVIPLLVRPGAMEFGMRHQQAKWWTFTNKDREVDGQIVRDVSDDDGLVGMYQPSPHEVSGRQVVDANKYALQALDAIACKHLNIKNEERPIIGVRGQRKDLKRVAKLIKDKRDQEQGSDPARPVTIILIDDRKCDAWGNCQANDERLLLHIPAYNAIAEDKAPELVGAMERILPVKTLLKFYNAFYEADPTHALIQCVDIMSDDQSMLLKKLGSGKDRHFKYLPKIRPSSQNPPPLPIFKRDHCRKW